MKPRSQERGQALIMIALAVVGLFGFTALAIDGSRVFSDRRHAQNAADTAALAAALAKVRGNNFVQAGLDRAASNGYVTDADSSVDVHLCSDVGLNPACEGIPGGDDKSEYIQVKIVSTIPTTFARIIGRATVTSVLTAVAKASGTNDQPPFGGAALVALKPDGPKTMEGTGNVSLDVNNSGVFNNSTDSCGMNVVGNGSYSVDTSFQMVSGTYCNNGNTTLNGGLQQPAQIPYPPANLIVPPPSISCSGNGSQTYDKNTNTYTLQPGNWNGMPPINGNGNVNFSPGNYCFNGSVIINGPTNVVANNVNFKITSGEFKIAGGTFTCDKMLVYIDGGSGMHFTGNGGTYCNEVTFYARTGDVTWNGNVSNRLYAPTGGTYEGLLIYLPYENSSALTINGTSGNELTGSIIAVHSPITVNGNSMTNGLHTAITGYTIGLSGVGTITINYDPKEQYVPIEPNMVGLTK